MIKRILSIIATVALVLVLGACLDFWRERGVSLVAPGEPAIVFDRNEG